MKHYLLFDSGCTLCTGLAQAVERESDGLLTAKSLRDQEMQKFLAQARPDWKHEPTLLEIQDDHVVTFTGIAMRVRLIAILGPQRAYRVANVVRGFDVSITGLELSRRSFFSYSAKALAGFALLGIPGLRRPVLAALPPQGNPPIDGLQPGVREFIANNCLVHSAEFPDPNEQVEPLRAYLESRELIQAGKIDEAISMMQSIVSQYAESRHAHAGLGRALYAKYEKTQSENDLQQAVEQMILADSIGIRYGRAHYTKLVAKGFGIFKDRTQIEPYFKEAIGKGNRTYQATLDYAQALRLIDDPRAEKWFQSAMSIEPEGVWDALAYYAEWLLDKGRNDEVVKLVPDSVSLYYAHFLKGVALERLEQLRHAEEEYAKFSELSLSFPAPNRYRISGSNAQGRIFFQGDSYASTNAVDDPGDEPSGTDSQVADAKRLLARVIEAEAGGETQGGRRAVGWTVRTRVYKAYSVPRTCGGYDPNNNGAWRAVTSTESRPAKYTAICNLNQFSIIAGEATPTNVQIASQVWHGQVPDPISWACRKGEMNPWDEPCSAACSESAVGGAFSHGAPWFQAESAACPNCHDFDPNCTSGCMQQGGVKTCGNGAWDNCFYRIA